MPTADLSGDLTSDDVARLAEHFEPLRAEELVEFAAEQFGGSMVLTCSWQLGTSILVHMTREVAPQTRLVEIDTGLLFPETHDDAPAPGRPLRPRGRDAAPAAERRGAGGRTAPRLWEREPTAAAACARSSRSSARSATPTAGSPASAATRPSTRARAPQARARRAPRRRQGAAAGRLERARLLALRRTATASRTTSCTTAASRRSAARPARAPPAAARTRAPAAGPAAARPSAACTSPEGGCRSEAPPNGGRDRDHMSAITR